jgi:cell shape-determining protein MreD
MRRAIILGSGLVAAFFATTLLGWIHPAAVEVVNAFVVAVLLVGLLQGEVAGAAMGALGGLVVDAFSLGVFGIAGLALTTMGFFTGFVSRKIHVLTMSRLFVFFGLMAAAELILWAGLTVLVFGRSFPWSGGLILFQPAANAALATALFVLYRKVKARRER